MKRLIDEERRPLRREYSAAFKASVLEQTRERGASVGGVALRHGLHPNMVHRWLREQRLDREQDQQSSPGFVPLAIPVVAANTDPTPSVVLPQLQAKQAIHSGDVICIEIERTGAHVKVRWPASASAECAQLLRDWLR